MNAPQPFPYQGSKRRLAPDILCHVPAGTVCVLEPFAGSAAVSLAAAATRAATRFVINDINQPLVALWREIVDRPEGLAAQYQELWEAQQDRPREFYNEVRAEFNRAPRPDLLLFLLARCVKASVRYNARGEFNQSPDNRRKGMRPGEMRQNIVRASQCLAGRATLMSADYRAVLAMATPADLVYMDPPYQGVCGNRDPRYLSGVLFDEFIEDLDRLNQRQVPYILSYDGRTGEKSYGRALPTSLRLTRLEVDAGRSSQATLLGTDAKTYESIYLSPALAKRGGPGDPMPPRRSGHRETQLALFGE